MAQAHTTARTQHGLGLLGFLLVLTAIGILGMVVLKAFPSYMEYFTIQSTVDRIAHDPILQNDAEIRAAFDRQMRVDMIDEVRGRDLEISKGVVAVRYQKTVPLTDNISLLINFDATSNQPRR